MDTFEPIRTLLLPNMDTNNIHKNIHITGNGIFAILGPAHFMEKLEGGLI